MKSQKDQTLLVESFPVGTLRCNCSIIYSPQTLEAIIIDPGNDWQLVYHRVKEKHLKVRLLLHTHAHFDHIGQSDQLRSKLGCSLLLHQDDLFLYENLPAQGLFFGERISRPQPVDSFIKQDDMFGLLVKGAQFKEPRFIEFLKTLHTPGHTPGSCSFYSEHFNPPLLFSGDTLFLNSIGRTDLPGGDANKIVASIKHKLFVLPDETVCIPGHGEKTCISKEKRTNPFV